MFVRLDLGRVSAEEFAEVYTRRWPTLRVLLRYFWPAREFPDALDAEVDSEQIESYRQELWEFIQFTRSHNPSALRPFQGLLLATCPRCGVQAIDKDEVKETFGLRRRLIRGKQYTEATPQSYCFACRRAERSGKRAAAKARAITQ